MAGSKNAYRRFRIIDSCIRNKMRPYPSMEDLIKACWEKLDMDISSEAIQKDIRQMKDPAPDGFDAPIKYCRKNKGYYYTDMDYSINGTSLNSHDIDALKEALDVLEGIGGSRVSEKFGYVLEKISTTVQEEFGRKERANKIIQTDSPPPSRGFEHFDILFRACREKVPVSIVHYSYRKRRFKTLTIHPILLKEFDNKWYVVAHSELHNALRTFGLDRIYEPLLLRENYIKADAKEQEIYMNDVYGVYPLSDEPKQVIQVEASPLATNYFQAYPIHKSQKVKVHNHGSSTISFKLVPSMELVRLFMSYGKEIQITKPTWMRHYIENAK